MSAGGEQVRADVEVGVSKALAYPTRGPLDKTKPVRQHSRGTIVHPRMLLPPMDHLSCIRRRVAAPVPGKG